VRSGETARGAVAVQDAAAPAPEDNPGVLLIAQMAWISFLEALREKRQLFGSAVAVYGMLQLLKAFAQAALVDPLIGQQTTLSRIFLTQLGLDTLFSFAGAFVLAAVAVPVHRMILRDEHGDGVIKPFSGLVVRFAMWVLAIDMAGALIVSPAIMGSISNPGLRGAIFAMAAIMIVAVIYVTVRWSLAFPAIAIGRPAGPSIRVPETWELSRGRFWKLFITPLLAIIPLSLAVAFGVWIATTIIVAVGNLNFTLRMEYFGALRGLTLIGHLARAVQQTLIGVGGVALGAAVLSWNYRIARVQSGSERLEPS